MGTALLAQDFQEGLLFFQTNHKSSQFCFFLTLMGEMAEIAPGNRVQQHTCRNMNAETEQINHVQDVITENETNDSTKTREGN